MQLLLVPFERHLYLGDVLGMSGRVQKERTFGVQPSIEVVSVNFFRIEAAPAAVPPSKIPPQARSFEGCIKGSGSRHGCLGFMGFDHRAKA